MTGREIDRYGVGLLRCILLFCILCLWITSVTSAAEFPDKPLKPEPLSLNSTPVYSSCQAPCECLNSNDADLKWGAGNYVLCSSSPCDEYRIAGGEIRILMFCYRQTSGGVMVTTAEPVRAHALAQQVRQDPVPVQTIPQDPVPAQRVQREPVPVQPVHHVTFSGDSAGGGGGIDLNAMVQSVLRDAYLAMATEFHDIIDKVNTFNQFRQEERDDEDDTADT